MVYNNYYRIFGILVVSAYLFECGYSYNIPEPILEVTSPKGFKVSIPADPGIVLFGFHGTKNKKILGNEPGDYEGEITRKQNGRFTYENTKTTLNPGDILYYWIHVQHNGYGYRLIDKSITVTASNSKNTLAVETTGSSDSCKRSTTLVKGVRPCEGELIFEDNFDILNWTKWRREIQIPLDTEDADFVSFQDRPENCYVNSGLLHIVPNLLTQVPGYDEQTIRVGQLDLGSRCTGIIDIERECRRRGELFAILPPVVSAKLRTKEFFSFLYGRIEVRAKLTKGDWLFPQIFLEPYASEYGINGFSSGQMRVAFSRGNEILRTTHGSSINGQLLVGGVVLTSGNELRDIRLRSTVLPNHLGTEFHTYGMTWTEEAIQWSVDGRIYATMRGGFSQLANTHNITHAKQWEFGSFMAPFDKEFFITLGVSAGGIADFPDDSVTGSSNVLKPWENNHPKAELKFWNAREYWHQTWDGESSGMTVDYIRVWAL